MIPTKYNYSEAISFLQQQAVQEYGPGFTIPQQDLPVIYMLLCYFLQDKIAAPHLNIDLDKGILLTGPVGSGKTTIIKLMRLFTTQQYIVKSCRNIAYQFLHHGYDVIHRYSSGSLSYYMPQVYCFDDLGTETNMKYYGNECNVMAEILLNRYDLYDSRELITNITTNLTAGEIEAYYDIRVRSRVRRMFNLVSYPPDTSDKRT